MVVKDGNLNELQEKNVAIDIHGQKRENILYDAKQRMYLVRKATGQPLRSQCPRHITLSGG
jgi:hypothetical protein